MIKVVLAHVRELLILRTEALVEGVLADNDHAASVLAEAFDNLAAHSRLAARTATAHTNHKRTLFHRLGVVDLEAFEALHIVHVIMHGGCDRGRGGGGGGGQFHR